MITKKQRKQIKENRRQNIKNFFKYFIDEEFITNTLRRIWTKLRYGTVSAETFMKVLMVSWIIAIVFATLIYK